MQRETESEGRELPRQEGALPPLRKTLRHQGGRICRVGWGASPRGEETQAEENASAPVASGTDDWLDGVDSHDDDASFDDAPRSAPPAVIGQKRKKKKKAPEKQSKIDSLRDEDGDLPMALHWMMMVGTGLVGGAIASAIWAAIIYYTEAEVGFVAILVGVLAGTGVRVGASRWDYGWGPALTAVGVAAFSILVGKFLGIYFLLKNVGLHFADFADVSGATGSTLGTAAAIAFSFHPIDVAYDLLWLVLACSGAFKIAAGWEDDD